MTIINYKYKNVYCTTTALFLRDNGGVHRLLKSSYVLLLKYILSVYLSIVLTFEMKGYYISHIWKKITDLIVREE